LLKEIEHPEVAHNIEWQLPNNIQLDQGENLWSIHQQKTPQFLVGFLLEF
jgi:hypothetical protein